MILSSDTILPKASRNAVKAFIRKHPGFEALRAAYGVESRDISRAQWIEMANRLNIASEVQAILDNPTAFDQTEDDDSTATTETTATKETTMNASTIETDIDSVLSPVLPFISDKMKGEIVSRLRPIVEAAHKPPVEVERIVEKTVTVETTIDPVTGEKKTSAPLAKIIGKKTFADIFGTSGKHAKKTVAIWNDVTSPGIDDNYVFNDQRIVETVPAFERGENIWLFGKAGTGKSVLGQEYAARTGRHFTRIGFTRSTETIDLVGQKEPVPVPGGGTRMAWVDGPFTAAVRRPGAVVLLDELTIAPPGTNAYFQTAIDLKKMTLSSGEVVSFAEGVVIIVADNTAGYGDETGVYAGTQSANAALVDRMFRLVEIDYLPPHEEGLALHRKTKLPLAACILLTEAAANVRKTQEQSGGEARPFSFRRLLSFVGAYEDGLSFERAWHLTALSRLPEADRETVRQAIKTHFDHKAFACLAEGKPLPVAASPSGYDDQAPSAAQRAAQDAFGNV